MKDQLRQTVTPHGHPKPKAQNVTMQQTLEKFRQIENMIKLQKAKLSKNESQILQPSKSAYGNKSVNITRAESQKKKEASCVTHLI